MFVPARPMGSRVNRHESPEDLQRTKRRFLRGLALTAMVSAALLLLLLL